MNLWSGRDNDMGMEGSFSETYEILGKLGEGSGGIVYKAYHKRLRQEVVLKKVRNRGMSYAASRQEVDILKKLHHSYLPQVFDFLEIDGSVYTVMSYVQGKSFAQLIKEGHKFTQQQLIRWGMQISSALNCLHSQKPPVIHGDIKPANIMLTKEGDICLIDFNISFYLDHTAVLGYTNGYTSPEQYIMALSSSSGIDFPEKSNVDERTDIYSVGAALYHIATGQKIKDCRQKIDKELLTQYTGEAFAQVIERATKIAPQDRYQTALELFRAFENISKKDRRYQSLLHRQTAIRIGIVTAMAGFIVLGGYGIHRIRLGITEQYNRLVEEQIDLRQSGEYEDQEVVFEEASALIPSALESYYQNAYSLYMQEEYEECISFIDYDICENEDINLIQARMADVYYLEADSYFKLQKYDESLNAYEKLFRLGTKQTEYYRDYAIVLAYSGDAEGGQEILQKAIDYGLKEDSIYYAKGEMENAQGRYDAAIQEFQQCIGITDDDGMKERAYLMLYDIYDEKGEDVNQRNVLIEARQTLPVENQMQVLERLAQIDIELADKSGNSDYRKEAINVLLGVEAQGWATYDTYDTLAVLYEKQGQLDMARQAADTMLEKYGEDYNIYMRYAFLEIDAQELLANTSRDYTQFVQYYEKALQLYTEQQSDNNVDSEMELLKNLYAQVVEGGWVE